MTAKKSISKKSDKIDYAEITEAEVQSVWPDLCMADRYQIAYEKVLQNMPAYKQTEMADKGLPPRHMREFLKEVVRAAEAENFHVN
jgi:hypothetical protein